MTTKLQLVIDCLDPQPLVRFWSEALGYVLEPAPGGYATWREYWLSIGVPADELEGLEDETDSIVDPAGVGPRIFFQLVPESKSTKNRLHLDLMVSGGREHQPLEVRRERVDQEVARLLVLGATQLRRNSTEGLDHYGVVMQDPAGNEFCVA